jgi:hypothetical protein
MNSKQEQRSHLFLVRFWSQGSRDGQVLQECGRKELSGRVQHVLTGEARTFDDWPTLIDLLLEMAETEGVEDTPQRSISQEVSQ